ncbi:hypothetical protein [Mycobacteroides abscessus]|uniref:hypothetical protein n=1 Tax=Mycobacteroides abscessus TaxID=36809 RepID=UPI000925B46C|nr:hypothetical protein [Mycobacteroides abscessus]SIC21826.1 Uncharacterised protein [Mycobacteroides abscessus subsp. abscessus]
MLKFFGWLALWPFMTPIRLLFGVTATLLYIVGLFGLGLYLVFRRPRQKATADDAPRTVINQYFYGHEAWPLPVQHVRAPAPVQHTMPPHAAALHPSRRGVGLRHKESSRQTLPSWSWGEEGMN